MNTLLLLSSLSVGGSEVKIVKVANTLAAAGAGVHLGYLNGPETLLADLEGLVPRVCFERRGKFSWSCVQRLGRYVREHSIERIVCINLYPLLYASALRFVFPANSPEVVVTVNTVTFTDRWQAAQMAIYAPLMRRANRVAFGCRQQCDLWVSRYHLMETKAEVIYNGVDATFFRPEAITDDPARCRVRFGIQDPSGLVVGTVGVFRREKRQSDIIEAVRRLRNRGLNVLGLLVGDGERESALRDQARQAGIAEHIRFAGALRDVRPALAAMDVFVLPSQMETFSNSVLEAMAMAKPVVMTDVGGAREMIEDGISGWLYPPADVGKLSQRLATMANDRAAIGNMGQAGRRRVTEQFSFSRMVDAYHQLCFAAR